MQCPCSLPHVELSSIYLPAVLKRCMLCRHRELSLIFFDLRASLTFDFLRFRSGELENSQQIIILARLFVFPPRTCSRPSRESPFLGKAYFGLELEEFTGQCKNNPLSMIESQSISPVPPLCPPFVSYPWHRRKVSEVESILK